MMTVPAVLLAALLVIPLSVIIIPVSLVIDLLRGRPRLPTLRVFVFGLNYLAWEVIAISFSAVMWFATGFGLLSGRHWSQEAHRKLQVVWAASHIRMLRRALGMRLEVINSECLAPGPVVLLSRHASMIDTLIPIFIADENHLGCRYVLKNELLWDPALDIIGHRFPNYFVDRSGGNSGSAIDEVGALAAGTRDSEVFVIFPEGSRFTEAKRERALEKLRDSNPAAAERAEKLTRTMPPRTGGPIAALQMAPPGADIVVLAHTGLEGMAGPRELWRVVPFRHPIQIELWRIPRVEVPTDPDEQLAWLYDRWAEVDTWVGDHQPPGAPIS